MTRETEAITEQVDPKHLEYVVVRTARKQWTCTGTEGRNEQHPDCTGTIQPGSIYIEYVGDVVYQSGTRYCLACGLLAWGKTPDAAGVIGETICVECGDEWFTVLGEVMLECPTCGGELGAGS